MAHETNLTMELFHSEHHQFSHGQILVGCLLQLKGLGECYFPCYLPFVVFGGDNLSCLFKNIWLKLPRGKERDGVNQEREAIGACEVCTSFKCLLQVSYSLRHCHTALPSVPFYISLLHTLGSSHDSESLCKITLWMAPHMPQTQLEPGGCCLFQKNKKSRTT